MDGWDQVRWTEARQVAELMRADEGAWPDGGVSPRAHFAALRDQGDAAAALAYLGHALPRFEALAWACAFVEQEAAGRTLRPRDRRALDAALRWLGDPDDRWRRAAFDTAEDAGDDAPERLLAFAVFFSGGSISQPDLPPVLHPPEIAGAMAAAAVTVAAYRNDEPAAALDRALALGDKVAALGTRALKEA